MKVKDLRKQLEYIDGEREVILQKDGEGNGYSPLSSISKCVYGAESTFSGYIGIKKLTEEYKKEGYGEEDVIEDGVRAIVLTPMN